MSASSDYLVADIGLADWGRRELAIAETEMPGLMALRRAVMVDEQLRVEGGLQTLEQPIGHWCAGKAELTDRAHIGGLEPVMV